MDRPLVALVLAGGTGSRLYPASRPDRPKQFLSLDDDRSLLARTVERASFADHVLVSTRPDLVDGVRERVDAEVLVEPAARDTGPALLFATHRVAERFDDPVVAALPSDHRVGDPAAFADAMRTAARVAAREGALVTVGVAPDRPATEYGYVQPGDDRGDHRAVSDFHEKPDAETAARYLEAGYLWNAGTFAWTPRALREAARDSPLAPLVDALEAGDPERGFAAVDPVSVDRAILERAGNVAVVPAAFDWDDLGSWDALGRVLPTDAEGNAALDPDDLLAADASGNVVATDGAHVSLVGVDDLAVVAFDDRVLVVPRARAQEVREVVERLRDRGRLGRRDG